ncbi:metallophosphoesterase [uncultured Paracoccus sp.]|uniref:metallophosphoesterase n=1 Tax=uncultured Paracoccus sp. TaxID=189685 RepID=UPI0025CFD57A|nr:metallophosphoesterase [uncultured Paracoccus sp.]
MAQTTVRDMLVTLKTQDVSYDLTDIFGAGASNFTVTNSNGEAVAATIDGSVLTLSFEAFGLSDLTITATGLLGQTLTDTARIRVAGEGAYTIAILPDTQDYTSNPAIAHNFTDMTQWIADNAADKGIGFVTHVGDITQWAATSQYTFAKQAMQTLRDAGIPFSVLPGNHDIGNGGSSDTRKTDAYNAAFSVGYMSEDPTYGGAYDQEPGRYDNNFHLWTAPDGTEWIFLNLEFGPRDDVLRWADEVLTQHGGRKAMIATHSYNNFNGRHDPLGDSLEAEGAGYDYGLGKDPQGSRDGEEIWREVIASHPNVVFTAGGHIFGDGAETVVSYNDYGNAVYQFLVNYQNGVAQEANQGGNGGNGAIRLVTVDPENDTVHTETYFTQFGEYFTGYRGTTDESRDGLTGDYKGHQEDFQNANIGARDALALADAGHDRVVTAEAGRDTATVALSADGTTNPKGDIVSHVWTDRDGTVVATGADASVDLGAGIHDLTLTVTTSEGIVSRDETRVIVKTDGVHLVETFNAGDADGWVNPAAGAAGNATIGTDVGFLLPGVAGGQQQQLTLQFDSHWRPEGTQTAEVLVSIDGGAPVSIMRFDTQNTTDGANLNETISLDFAVPDSAQSVQFFWKMSDAGNNWYWAVDNISVKDADGTVLMAQNFDQLADRLNPSADEGISDSVLGWTHEAPEGWAVENAAGMPQGTQEWQGWSFATPTFWTSADGQLRADFTKGQGVIAVADPDEWDDYNDGSQNGADFDSTLRSPDVALGGDGSTPSTGVLKLKALSPDHALLVQPEGVSGKITEYTLVYDLYVEDGNGTWTALLQTDLANGSDGELFIRNRGDGTGGIGISSNYTGNFTYDAWNRVAFSVSVEGGQHVLTKFINGVQVGRQVVDTNVANGSRWTLDGDKGFLLFADESNETTPLYAAAVAFTPKALDAAAIAAMGGVDLDGPLSGSQPAGSVQLTFDGALDAANIGGATVTELDLGSDNLLGQFMVKGSAMAGGTVQAPQGALFDQSNGSDNMVVWKNGDWADLILQTTIRSMDNDSIGVAFNYSEDGHYLLVLDNQTNLRQLIRVEGDSRTVLASETGGYTFNIEQDLVVSNSGGRITATLDGMALFGGAVTDADPLGSGTVGLYSSGQKSSIFDDVVVRDVVLTAHAGSDRIVIDWNGDRVETVALNGAASILPTGSASAVWTGAAAATGLQAQAVLGAGRNDATLVLDGQSRDSVRIDVASGDRLIAADRFEDGDHAGWRIVDTTELGGSADWQVIDGALVETSGAYSRELTWAGASAADVWNRGWSPLGDGAFGLKKGSFALWDGDTGLTDYAIQAQITAPRGVVGLMLNYVDENNYYKIDLDARNGLISLVKVVDNYESAIARSAATYTPGDSFLLEARIVDGKITATMDGLQLFSLPIEVRDIASGAAGVWSWGAAGAQFDDIAIVDLSTGFLREIHGTAGNDRLTGTAADEAIFGHGGRLDVLTGSAGADVFVFGAALSNGQRETTRITDYQAGIDKLDLNGAEVVRITEGARAVTLWLGADRDQLVIDGITDADALIYA